LVTVHDPICTDGLSLERALYGSFLPVPPNDLFPLAAAEDYTRKAAAGAVVVKRDPIILNAGREKVTLKVTNEGDRPIQVLHLQPCPQFHSLNHRIQQVGSHYHFIETNPALVFDRSLAYGKRLNIPAGTAVRFEPGDTKSVTLTEISGSKIVTGGNKLATGIYSTDRTDSIVAALIQKGFGHVPDPSARTLEVGQERAMSREAYAGMFGPTKGDRVRLGDTSLWIEVEKDFTSYGDECKFGGGKTLREGMGQATNRSAREALDLVITNAVIVDWTGIYKVGNLSQCLTFKIR